MSARKKRFPQCGHLGYGEFCHRCNQALVLERALAKAQNPEVAKQVKLQVARLRGSKQKELEVPKA